MIDIQDIIPFMEDGWVAMDEDIYINGYKFNKKKKKFERTIFSYLKCLFA